MLTLGELVGSRSLGVGLRRVSNYSKRRRGSPPFVPKPGTISSSTNQYPNHRTPTPFKSQGYRRGFYPDETSAQSSISSAQSSDQDDSDFFGIKYFSADDIKGVNSMDDEKRKKLQEKIDEIKNLEALKASEEGFTRVTSFGSVRFDRENKVDYTGQFENDPQYVMNEKRRLYLLGLSMAEPVPKAKDDCEETQTEETKEETETLNFVDSQYFNILKGKELTKEESPAVNEDLNYIDYQYFKQQYSPDMTPEGLPAGPIKFHFTPEWEEYREVLNTYEPDDVVDNHRSPRSLIDNLDYLKFSGDSPLRSVEEVAHELSLIQQTTDSTESIEIGEDDREEQVSQAESQVDRVETDEVAMEVPKTALEYVTKIREGKLQPEDTAYLNHLKEKYKKLGSEFKVQETGKRKQATDSTGKRSFLEQTPQLHLLRRDELVQLLADRVIFNERDLIAIDKPNGLIVEGGNENTKYPCLEPLLPQLSKKLFGEENQLFKVHRLDRDATGVLLLARSLSMAATLRDLFAERKINKYYWAIVKGVPKPAAGIIDIPIEVGKVGGVERMVLRPECDADFNRTLGQTRGALPAITHYRLLRRVGNACMLEVKPEQGIKHQIRVHLGLGLRTPILGDHKYSYLDRIAPQKLSDDLLLALNVRQQKARNIPLHLHAKLYIIPEIGINGGSISIPAHLPGFFKANMSSLGLFSAQSVVKKPIAF